MNFDLRLVIGMDEEHRVFKTITPSEPAVVHTAVGLLFGSGIHGSSHMHSWAITISTLTTAIHPALIDKGLKGELFARNIYILFRDFLFDQFQPLNCNWSNSFMLMEFPSSLSTELESFKLNIGTGSEFFSRQLLPQLLHDLLRQCAGLQLALIPAATAWKKSSICKFDSPIPSRIPLSSRN